MVMTTTMAKVMTMAMATVNSTPTEGMMPGHQEVLSEEEHHPVLEGRETAAHPARRSEVQRRRAAASGAAGGSLPLAEAKARPVSSGTLPP